MPNAVARMTLLFITGNARKFAEASAIIPGLQQLELDLPELQEIDAKVIIEHKLRSARAELADGHGPFIVEDVSLHMQCLDGMPGPLIKWFLKAMTHEGLARIAALYDNPRAEVVCRIGLMEEDGTVLFFEGRLSGSIVAPRGENTFGWDAIFQPEGYDLTYAQMSPEEKNDISHRRKALNKLNEYLTLRAKNERL